MTYDWSTSPEEDDHARIRWAVFYSDVEHEVLEVTSGHRITLTYNLYAVRGNGLLAGHCPTLDPAHLPLFQFAKGILVKKDFMTEGMTNLTYSIASSMNTDRMNETFQEYHMLTKLSTIGGHLGFFCTHAYAHTETNTTILPDMLKGLDMVVWETFTGLNLKVIVRPAVHYQEERYFTDEDGLEAWEDINITVVGEEFHRYNGDYTDGKDGLIHAFSDKKIDSTKIHWLSGMVEGTDMAQIDYIAVS